MIKSEFGEKIEIVGNPAVIATELEELARRIREAFCNSLGQETGEDLFDECIRASRLTTEERDKDCANILEKTDEVAKSLLDKILEDFANGMDDKKEEA